MSTAADSMDSVNELKDRASQAARRAARTGKREMGRFLDDVEELLANVTHIDDAELARMRSKVEQSLGKARATVANGTQQLREQASHAAAAADGYARERPWAVAGAAALIGLAIGAVLSRR